MTDVVDQSTRSQMMSNIRSKNTRLELLVRKELWSLGYRYRCHDKKLPGKPDMVFPKYHAVIFTNGCFWHGHSCSLFKAPASNSSFWSQKISANKTRDAKKIHELRSLDWRVMTVWEYTFRGKEKLVYNNAIKAIEDWLISDSQVGEIRERAD